ncbi:MAG: site-2 protease family protein [Oscillospiraceae bacterium]|nr:site-2 protease family protein [Oscillospiraceae bacterium]
MQLVYILIAILAFGILIADHELGHFLTARLCGIRVNEFAIGMGPALFKKQGKETLYALRLIPVGGYCAMEGEDVDTGDPRAFSVQRRLKKFLVLIAGALNNLILGFLLVAVLVFSSNSGFVVPTVTGLADGFPQAGEQGLLAGDTIYSIDGFRLYYSNDLSTAMSRSRDGVVDMVVVRDGKRVLLEDYELVPREYDGVLRYGINLQWQDATFGGRLKYSLYTTYNFVRLIRFSLSDLFTGAVGLKDMSGPVGIVSTISEVGTASENTKEGLLNVLFLVAFIAVNLAVMNLLPIPALDGGRVFFLVVTWLLETILRRPCNPKVEQYIHSVGMILLLALMAVIMISDVVKLIYG